MSSGDKKGQADRRRFIKSFSAAIFASLGAKTMLKSGEVLASGDNSSAGISGSSRKVVEALAETIIPSEGPERPGALDLDLVSSLLDFLGKIPGAKNMFLGLCWFWEFSPLWSGRWARLSRLSLEQRTKVLEQWESSKVPLKRAALLPLKMVFLAAFYNNPRIWPYIGYEPGCLSGAPVPAESLP